MPLLLQHLALSLRSARIKANMTMRELAAKAGISAQMVHFIEAGARNTSLDQWERLFESVGCRLVVTVEPADGERPDIDRLVALYNETPPDLRPALLSLVESAGRRTE